MPGTKSSDPAAVWRTSVTDSFGYLVTEFGYTTPDIQMHFRGNLIQHVGPTYTLRNMLDTETGWIDCHLVYDTDSTLFELPIWRLLETRVGQRGWRPPPIGSFIDAPLVRSLIPMWASGLKEHAADVLAGGDPRTTTFDAIPWPD